jgi:hypothetical protein
MSLCPHCDEPVENGPIIPHLSDDGWAPQRWHWECFMRGIVGGLNHQRGLCICCGGSLPPDPPEMTPREAAIDACAL